MRRPGITTLVAIAMLASLPLPSHAAKKTKKKIDRKDVILAAEFPEITPAQRSLTEVPYAKGAPAVILLEANETDYLRQPGSTGAGGLMGQRIRYLRRIKILTPAGVQRYGNFVRRSVGSWRVHKVQARTVLPDGTIVDASDNVFQETSEDLDYHALNIAFPRVAPGAILDVMIDINSDFLALAPWIAQREIPVLESRFTILPTSGLQFFPMAFPPEVGAPEEITFGNRNGYVWTFRDVPPLPDVEFLPPDEDIAQRLVVILTHYKDRSTFYAFATDWKQFSKRSHERWEAWTDRSHRKAAALAREVAGESENSIHRAEAIRRALRQRVSSQYGWDYPIHESPDEVLERGSGNSADLAGLTLAMLKAAGIKADLMAIRRRSGGSIPLDRPAPGLLDELLVRLPGSVPVYYSPAASLPVGKLPWDCTGVAAIALDGKAEKVVLIPDLTAADNVTERTATASLHADGRLTGESVHAFRGSVADRWRRRMDTLDHQKRRERFALELGRHMEGIRIESLALEHLDGPGDELVVKAAWEVPDYAGQAGTRLIVNPNLFSRQSAEGWAAPTRSQPIDLQMAFEEKDTVTITLPEGVGQVDIPGAANVNAGPGGFFRATSERRGDTVVTERHLQVNLHAFPPQAYGALRQWFTAAATSDDRPFVADRAP